MKTNSPEQPSHFRPAYFQDPGEHPGNWDQWIWGRHPGLRSAGQSGFKCVFNPRGVALTFLHVCYSYKAFIHPAILPFNRHS